MHLVFSVLLAAGLLAQDSGCPVYDRCLVDISNNWLAAPGGTCAVLAQRGANASWLGQCQCYYTNELVKCSAQCTSNAQVQAALPALVASNQATCSAVGLVPPNLPTVPWFSNCNSGNLVVTQVPLM